ncbi:MULTISPECIES: hypothetical protein [unclassified Nocardia]|uniref:hypothetical protein n=1 Tax=unclassified Nocardia TaxID=2637762 RepID=UPI001CE3E679|nr:MULTISPECIES: hypothetical protein [unclassified Nocardia]
MTATIGHVRGCTPSTMVTYGTQLAASNESFVGSVDKMRRDVEGMAKGWRGDGAAAASARAVGERLSATYIDDVASRIAAYYKAYGTQLDLTRTAIMTIVDNEAPAAGMRVADDGTVTAPKYPGGNGLSGLLLQARLDAQAQDLQSRIQDLLKSFDDDEHAAAGAIKQGTEGLQALAKAPVGPMPKLAAVEVLKSADGRYHIGDPAEPSIPHDDTFIYNSKESDIGDLASAAEWKTKLLGAEAIRPDLDDATRLYRHYWDNNGEPMEFDYSKAYKDDPNIHHAVDYEVSKAAAAADQMVRAGQTNFKMTGKPLTVGGADPNLPYPATEDWQKAVGGYQQWSHSNVRVEGNRVVMDVTVEAKDYYNFDKGKADVATGTNDSENGRFTEIGWAKPFDTHGRMTQTVSWEVGKPPSTATVDSTSEPGRGRRTGGGR